MNAIQCFVSLLQKGMILWVEDGEICYRARKGQMDDSTRRDLAAHKAEIISLLKENHRYVLPSFAQERLWFLDQLSPGNPFYNVPAAVRLRGALDPIALARSMNAVIERHEVLRTTFVTFAGQPVQCIAPALIISLPIVDLRGVSAAGRQVEAMRLAVAAAKRPFQLTCGPLLQATLLWLADTDYMLLLNMHHAVSDGWSMAVFMRELGAFYRAFVTGQPAQLPDLPVQYADFTLWQRQWLRGPVLASQLDYWKDCLAGIPAALELPTDRPRPAVQTFAGDTHFFTIPADLARALNTLSEQLDATLFMVLLAAFVVLLHRYSGQENVVVGVPVANRNRVEIEGLIGFFVNMLAIRTDVARDLTFPQLVARVREHALGAYAHQDVPFDKVVEALQPVRDLSRTPIFQVAFALQNTPMPTLDLPDLRLEMVAVPRGTARFDLALHLQETPEGLHGWFDYSTDLFDAATLVRLSTHLLTLLAGIVADPQQRLYDWPLMTPAERRQVLLAWNETQVDYPQDVTLHDLVEAQAKQFPDAVAIVYEDNFLTYQAVHQRVGQLAGYLQQQGVGPDVVVGICAERSPEMVIGLLAILMAGGAYLPLDPTYPQERLAFMLADAHAPLLLTQQRLLERLPTHGVLPICLDAGWEQIQQASAAVRGIKDTADHLAYVIYTSGSTGRPKGVAVPHRSIVNRLLWMIDVLHFSQTDCALHKSPFVFDVSIGELFLPLLVGARLVLARPGSHWDSDYLSRVITEQRVTFVHFVPSMLRLFLEEPGVAACRPCLKHVWCGGEVLPAALQEHFFSKLNAHLYNGYGPTEAAIGVTYWRCRPDDPHSVVPIGRPMANTQVYLLDWSLAPVPVGVPGELYIGGIPVSRGYLGRPALTAERFIPNPFATALDQCAMENGGGDRQRANHNLRLYRTGDLARYLPDGNIEFLGRVDQQVKVRGFRIELAEIEAVLQREAAVQKAAVIAREDDTGDSHLLAYIVPERGAKPTSSALRAALATYLPAYMLPSAFVLVDELPLTANGKLDYRRLPDPDRHSQPSPVTLPQTEVEQQIAAVWQDVLGVAQVGLHDNFFDLGGHSLRLIQVVNKLRQQIPGSLSVVDMFQHPTVHALAQFLHPEAAGPPAPARLVPQKPRPEKPDLAGGIAIIGMAGRFPGAPTLAHFWQNLRDGVESITFFSEQELAQLGIEPAPNYVRAAAILPGVDQFDASFFGYAPPEAAFMDPQHRLFLECAWEALEYSGYNPDTYEGLIGVYAGTGMNTYLLKHLYPHQARQGATNHLGVMIGSDKDHLTTRVSYKFNLKGPSVTVQTNCSTSLVAVCLACHSLLARQCDMALAGGASIHLPQQGYFYEEGNVLSPDGHCRAFDARAQGTVPGNGAGVVVLKRLEDALADGDHICAVIKGVATNNDGANRVGYTAPGVAGQAAVITAAQAMAGVTATSIQYIEAHGTGTPLGDPIEIAALTQAFQATTTRKQFCAIGSLKTNVGHLDAAAGVAGLIKTVLAIQHRSLPPSLHFTQPNPQIDFARTPFYVNNALQEWPASGAPCRAGVSSFGLGGTNAHVIVEEAPATQPAGPSRPWQLLVLSAKTEAALQTAATNLRTHLQQHSDDRLADVAYTLQVGRKAFAYRQAWVCQNDAEAIAGLESSGAAVVAAPPGERPVIFMFPGGGVQHLHMGHDLYRTEPVFRNEVDRCAAILQPHLGLDLRHVLYADADRVTAVFDQLDQLTLSLPAIFVTDYALARLWMSWGIRPQAMIGHSLGEYVAACLAGVFSLPDALALVVYRGQLLDRLPAGAMLSVPLPPEKVAPLLQDTLSVAAVNAPALCTVSGPVVDIDALEQDLATQGIDVRRLHVAAAAHSSLVTPVLDEFTTFVAGVRRQSPRLPFISNVTGDWVTTAEVTDPAYWGNHLRQTVRFADGIRRLAAKTPSVFLEVGPGQTLRTLTRKCLDEEEANAVLATMPHLKAPQPEVACLLTTLGALWLQGIAVDWDAFYAHKQRRRVPLPTYPFERRRHWIDPPASPASVPDWASAPAQSDKSARFYTPSWRRQPLPPLKPGEWGRPSRRWLLFVDDSDASTLIGHRLLQENQEVILVKEEDQFAAINDQVYTINPWRRGDYGRLLETLRLADRLPEIIVHLWEGATPPAPTDRAAFTAGQSRGARSLLALAWALDAQKIACPIWMVVENLHEVTGGDGGPPQQALLLDAQHAVSQRYPDLACHVLDTAIPPAVPVEDTVDGILAEIQADLPDMIVAHRGHYRWTPCLEVIPTAGRPASLPAQSVYLFTGGVNHQSVALAHALAQAGQPRLAFIDAVELPPKEAWDSCATADFTPCGAGGEPAGLAFDLARETAAIAQLESRLEDQVHIAQFPEGFEASLDALSASYIYHYLQQSQVDTEPGTVYDMNALRQRLRILPAFVKFFDFFIRTLAEEGIVRREGDTIRFLKKPARGHHPATWQQELQARYPAFAEHVRLLAHCASHYDRALTGEIAAISVLFPDGTFDMLRPIIEQGMKFSRARLYIELLASLLTNLARSSPRRLRILEVGAGTGQLTWPLAERLSGQNVSYLFTDIGKSFVLRAEREALRRGFDFMEFGVLDVAQDAATQGYEKYCFDVILAFDVVHATPDIVKSTHHLQQLLAPKGLLFLLEATRVRRWTTMMDGLAEGWWYFTDGIRENSPLLSPAMWQNVLRQQDFATVCLFPQPSSKRQAVDHVLMVAQQPAAPDTGDYRAWREERVQQARQRIREKIQNAQTLEAAGAAVQVYHADAGDETALQAAVARVVEQWGTIRGVFHVVAPRVGTTAGTLSEPDFRYACDLFALDAVLSSLPLTFRFLLHPPVAEGGRSHFLEAYAARHSGQPGWVSVAWDVGGRNTAVADAPEIERETLFMLLALETTSQIVVAPRAALPTWSQEESSQSASPAAAAVSTTSLHPRPHLRTAYTAPESELEQAVVAIWQEVLGLAQIGIHDNFFELGGESLLATQIISRLRSHFQVELPVRTLFERPTVKKVVEFIEEARRAGPLAAPAIKRVARSAYRATRDASGQVGLPKTMRDDAIEAE